MKLDPLKIASVPPVSRMKSDRPDNSGSAWLERSSAIALRINRALTANRMLQKEFAETLGIKPQQVSKILKGNVNLTLETISKLEGALGISLLEVPSCDPAIKRRSVVNSARSLDVTKKREEVNAHTGTSGLSQGKMRSK